MKELLLKVTRKFSRVLCQRNGGGGEHFEGCLKKAGITRSAEPRGSKTSNRDPGKKEGGEAKMSYYSPAEIGACVTGTRRSLWGAMSQKNRCHSGSRKSKKQRNTVKS